MENKIKYLEMIQSIISRMSGNSFALKGWAVTLIAGIFALASKDTNKMYFLVAYVPVLVFWGLDAYYLQLERKYRTLFNEVRLLDDALITFDMDIAKPSIANEKTNYLNCLVSATELWFYFPLAILSTVIIIITHL